MPKTSRHRGGKSSGEPSASLPTGAELADLLRRLRPKLRSVFAAYRIPVEDAEDIVQEVLLLAMGRWAEIANPEGWIVVVVRYRSVVYWRQRRVRQVRFVSMDSEALEWNAPEVRPEQERAEMRWDLARVSQGFIPRHRALLVLRYREGFSVEEVAEALEYSEASVRKISRRLIERLREAVGERGE
jgi:RNA polymerase sigma factor (sigma-70 family)